MLKSFITRTLQLKQLKLTPTRFFSDWAKDREKAAEKEFAMKEEREKLKKLKTKLAEEKNDVRFAPVSENQEELPEILKDREYLKV